MNKMYNFANKALENHVDRMKIEVKLIKDLSHNGEKGREAEGILKNFFKNMLPQSVSIGTGFTIDNYDNFSNQLDIMIYDSHFTPPIFQGYENSVVHIDSLDVTIETKLTYRNSKNIVLAAQKSANKVKKLSLKEKAKDELLDQLLPDEEPKYQHFSNYHTYEKEELISKKPRKIPLCILFAYSSDIKRSETILGYLNNEKNLVEKEGELPHHPGLDIICILDVGLFVRRKGKYESFFTVEVSNYKMFSTLYYILNNHIQNKERESRDYISTWFNGLLRMNMNN